MSNTTNINLKELVVSLDQLLLDPNNYRLDYGEQMQAVSDDQILDRQEETQDLLEKESLGELRESILTNGFLEVDKIVVRHLEPRGQGVYVVVEGNRRTAAYKSLIVDYLAGKISPPNVQDLVRKSKALNVVLIDLPPDEVEEVAASLMGIRHVSGPKRWTGYQSARLIFELSTEREKSLSDIGALLGISAHEAGRRLRGYSAYLQLKIDYPDYGSRASANAYTLLLEFISSRKYGRQWLGWDDEQKKFLNENNLMRLYEAIVPPEKMEAEIKNPIQAREFQAHLAIDEHRELIEEGKKLSELPSLPHSTSTMRIIRSFKHLLGDKNVSFDEQEAQLLREIQGLLNQLIGEED